MQRKVSFREEMERQIEYIKAHRAAVDLLARLISTQINKEKKSKI